MPDENKFSKLKEIGFSIVCGCGLCKHGNFPTPTSPWGTCTKHRYDHLKHANPAEGRGVSIHTSGKCDEVDPDPVRIATLGAHSRFLVFAKR